MLKVLKNLKNSWVTVLVIVVLLCIQAATDLALPDYTSKIVNVGIQYGGIEDAVPEVLSKEIMSNILFFTDEDDKILDNYYLVEKNPDSYQEKVIKKYLGEGYDVEENNLYVVKKLDEEQRKNLESMLTSPIIEYNLITNEETANQIKSQIMQNMPSEIAGLDNIDVMEILKQTPEEQRQVILEQFNSSVMQMSDSLKEQAAINETLR